MGLRVTISVDSLCAMERPKCVYDSCGFAEKISMLLRHKMGLIASYVHKIIP